MPRRNRKNRGRHRSKWRNHRVGRGRRGGRGGRVDTGQGSSFGTGQGSSFGEKCQKPVALPSNETTTSRNVSLENCYIYREISVAQADTDVLERKTLNIVCPSEDGSAPYTFIYKEGDHLCHQPVYNLNDIHQILIR